jgi:hypothetical protein
VTPLAVGRYEIQGWTAFVTTLGGIIDLCSQSSFNTADSGADIWVCVRLESFSAADKIIVRRYENAALADGALRFALHA